MEDLQPPVLVSGFVLSLRSSEILLTFPELPRPPEGLESEAHATLRYTNSSGPHTAVGHILRVTSGPPVTVIFKRVLPVGSDPRRSLVRTTVDLPVALHVLSSSLSGPVGGPPSPATAQNVSTSGMLLVTSRLHAVGDMVRLDVTGPGGVVTVHGRVVRVFESEGKERGQFGVGVELVHDSDEERERWIELAAELQRRR